MGDSFGEADSTFQKTTAAVEGTAAQAAIYAQRLKELEAAGLDTDAAHKEYELTVEKLNAILPELNLTIDEQTGLINGGTEALLRNIDAWKQAALEQAALDKYETELKAWAEAQLEVATNQAKLNSLGRDHKDLLERRAAVAQRLTEISQEIDAVNADVTLTYAEQAEKIRALNEETQALAEEHGALLNEIAANEKEQTVYTEAVEAGTEVLGGYEEQVEAAQEALKAFARRRRNLPRECRQRSRLLHPSKIALRNWLRHIQRLVTRQKKASIRNFRFGKSSTALLQHLRTI